MSAIMGLRDGCSTVSGAADGGSRSSAASSGPFYSPAKQKAVTRGRLYLYRSRASAPLHLRRAHALFLGAGNVRLLISSTCVLLALLFLAPRVEPLMGWNHVPHFSASSSSSSYGRQTTSRSGYTVLINTWKRNSLLKKAVAHYASCPRASAIHVVWSESDPPSDILKGYLRKLVLSQSQKAHKPNFRIDLNEEDNLNNRFKPIENCRDDAVFSVDDDVIVPCPTLDFAFTIWQSAPDTMVGFVPRMHWLCMEKDGVAFYKYGGWWSVWWMGTYSMVLSKAAFIHRKYLDMYTYKMPSSILDYVTRERNCEDIAMSLLVANATGAPPIWVKGKIHEIGSSGISSLKGHNKARNKCLNDFISLYGALPLVSTRVKAVDARKEWFW